MVLQNKIVKDFQFSNNLAMSVILNEGQGHQTKFWKRTIKEISQQTTEAQDRQKISLFA
jgi:hypothetical protein